MVELDNQISLKNGKILGYAEYGDHHGMPVIHLHGLPSSRFELNNPDLYAIAERLHLRIIVPDRPGIGLSEFFRYSIASYPDLIAELADALALDRFPVVGYSSGGKFAAACAWKIPERLTNATIVSGSAPFDLPGVKGALSKQDQQIYGMAVKLPWVLRLMLGKIARDARKNPTSVMSLFTDVSEEDRAALNNPVVQLTLGEMVNGAFQQGTRGPAYEWKIEALPWGFLLEEIRMPVQIWHGETDKIVSIEQARILAKAIPGASLKSYPGQGHTIFVNCFEEIMRTAVC